ncbi:PIN domain-containing protein [Sphingosinicella terrae]|uniref:PIN domain-containing protein n=1 Tax=Sphingosinicella terrae TaxID=2172047 RepID=UPI000E0D3260|nr:PIN domain-containing protein [Sphingosinicella terrae]
MLAIIDTNVAIHLRDGHPVISARIAALPTHPMISVLTRVELEGGVFRAGDEAAPIRARLDLLLSQYAELPLTGAEASIYARIVERCGYSRPRIIDRLIAATAIVHDAVLVTLNAADFRGIPDLKLETWSC